MADAILGQGPVHGVPFDVMAYLKEQLPGFDFWGDSTMSSGVAAQANPVRPFHGLPVNRIKARTTIHLYGQGEIDPVLFAVPDRDIAAKAWADDLIQGVRTLGYEKLGLNHLVDAILDEQRKRHDRQLAEVIRAKDALIGEAYSRGNDSGYAKGLAHGRLDAAAEHEILGEPEEHFDGS